MHQRSRWAPRDRLRHDRYNLGSQVQLELTDQITAVVEDLAVDVFQRVVPGADDTDLVEIVDQRIGEAGDDVGGGVRQTQERHDDVHVVAIAQHAVDAATDLNVLDAARRKGRLVNVAVEAKLQFGRRFVQHGHRSRLVELQIQQDAFAGISRD